MIRKALLVFAFLGLAACHGEQTTTVAHSSDINGVVTTNAIQLSHYAMRAALGNNPNTAAYVTITNTGTVADRLVSASCACAATASLHTMTMKDGVMDMAEAPEGFAIAPGQTLVFAPGGNHIMLSGLTTRPQDGGRQDVVLHFEKAGDITLSLPVSNAPLSGQDH